MKNYLTNISIWTGAIVAILTIVDWLLTESQKKKIKCWAENSWLWLDYQRMGKFVSGIRSFRLQIIFSIVTCVYISVLILIPIHNEDTQNDIAPVPPSVITVILLVTVAFVTWKIHPTVISWAIRPNSLLSYFIRISGAWLAGCVALFLMWEFIIYYAAYNEAYRNLAIYVLLWTTLSTILAEWGLIQTMFFLTLFWFFSVLILMGLFRITQFILYRIADNPKGPVLGISGLLIGIGALVKTFL